MEPLVMRRSLKDILKKYQPLLNPEQEAPGKAKAEI
jgi:hypothetical protein